MKTAVIGGGQPRVQPKGPQGPMPGAQFEPGTVIDGRYRLDEWIGGGMSADVWRAFHIDMRTHRAIKLFRAGVGNEVFKAEKEAIATIRHKNVIEIHDSGTHMPGTPASRHYYVMKTGGMPLREYSSRHGLQKFRSWSNVAVMFCAIAEGLVAIHTRGYAHCDIKPENILVSDEGEPLIIDFGLMRKVSGESMSHRNVVTTKEFRGTLLYAAPEQFDGGVSDRSDVFSLGLCLGESLLGRHVYGDLSPHAVDEPSREQLLEYQALALRCQDLMSANAMAHGIPIPLLVLLRSCLSPVPGLRPSSREVARELRTLVHADQAWLRRVGAKPVAKRLLVLSLTQLAPTGERSSGSLEVLSPLDGVDQYAIVASFEEATGVEVEQRSSSDRGSRDAIEDVAQTVENGFARDVFFGGSWLTYEENLDYFHEMNEADRDWLRRLGAPHVTEKWIGWYRGVYGIALQRDFVRRHGLTASTIDCGEGMDPNVLTPLRWDELLAAVEHERASGRCRDGDGCGGIDRDPDETTGGLLFGYSFLEPRHATTQVQPETQLENIYALIRRRHSNAATAVKAMREHPELVFATNWAHDLVREINEQDAWDVLVVAIPENAPIEIGAAAIIATTDQYDQAVEFLGHLVSRDFQASRLGGRYSIHDEMDAPTCLPSWSVIQSHTMGFEYYDALVREQARYRKDLKAMFERAQHR